MKLIPMGEYYVWHCDWCDSTNHTLWSRLGGDGLACAACHHHLVHPEPSPQPSRLRGHVRQHPVAA